MQSVGAAGKVGGEVEGGGGGQGDRAGGGVLARRGRRAVVAALPRPTSEPGSKIFVAISGTGRGQRSRSARTHVERPEGEDLGFGRRGVREGGRRPGRRPWRRPRPDRPALRKLLQACREAVRVGTARSSRAAASAIRLGVEAGRPAGEVAPQLKQLRRRPGSASPTAKRRSRSAAASALRRRILAEAAALCSARRGAARRRRAGRGAGARRGARGRRRRQNRGSPSPALPLPAPRPGPPPAAERLAFPGLSPRLGLARARCRSGAGTASPRSARRVGERGRDRRESLGHGESSAALCHALWRGIRPACREVGMSDKIALSDMIRKPAQTPCQTPQNQALSPSWPAQRPLRRRALSLARRRKTRRDG